MFGSGISPGFAELLAIVSATHLRPGRQDHGQRGRRHHLLRLAGHRATGGFGVPIDDPDLPGMAAAGHRRVRRGGAAGRRRARRGARRGAVRGRVRPDHRPTSTSARGPSRRDAWPASRPAGRACVGDQVVVELNVRWRKGPTLEPDWKIEQDGWVIQIDGRPTVTLNVGFLPPPDFEAETIADFMVLGHIMTAVPPLNAIAAVVAAPPGHRDLQRPAPHAAPRHRAAGEGPPERVSPAVPTGSRPCRGGGTSRRAAWVPPSTWIVWPVM